MALTSENFRPRNLAIAVSAILFAGPMIWATAQAHFRLGSMELRQDKLEVENRDLKNTIIEMRERLVRIDENVAELRRSARERARTGVTP